jgi:hypothetical protein
MICIGIALVFWLLVKLSQEYRSIKDVALTFNIPADKTFSAAPPNDLKVQVEGAGWDLMFDYFVNRQVDLVYDLMQTDRMTLNRGQLRTDILNQLSANDLTIVELNYDNINLVLEEKVSWKAPVVLASDLSFSTGYHLKEPVSIDPDSITITGPLSMLKSIQRWEADSLILQNLKTSQEKFVSLAKPPREISLSHDRVRTIVSVEQYTEKSLFVPLTVLNAPDSIKVFPANVQVRCIVGLSQYNSLAAKDFKLVLDLQDVPVSESKNTAPINLVRQPDYVKLLSFSPSAAEFYILK